MISGSCHCGAVRFTIETTPDWLTSCNCSYCRRAGGLWAHLSMQDARLDYATGDVIRYIQGDKTLAFVSCCICGCTTHWEPLDDAHGSRMAVNLNMADPDAIRGIRVRLFDGAESWTYLD